MTVKNIPFLYLTFIILSATSPGQSFPVPDDAITKPTFEPPREVLLLAANDSVAPAAPEAPPTPPATAAASNPAPTPAQAIAEKLAHTSVTPPPADSNSSPASTPEPAQEAPANLEAVSPQVQPAAATSQDGTLTTSDPEKDDIVIKAGDTPVSVPGPLPQFEPTTLSPPAADPTEGPVAPTDIPDTAAEDLPTTVLTVPPTSKPAATAPAQFFSISTNPYATFTSHATPSSTKPSVPLPSQGPLGESEVKERSHRTAVVGSLVAVGIIMSLVAFVFCFRCQCFRRNKRRSSGPLDLLAEDHERESLSVGDKEKSSLMSPTMGMTVPILRSYSPHAVTYSNSPEQQEWRLIPSPHELQTEEVSHIVPGDFMEVDLTSQPDLYVAGIVTEDNSQPPNNPSRTSAGAVSTGGQSYSTRASTYSTPSIDQSGQPGRISASFEKLNQLASLATSPAPSTTKHRKRSKTETSASLPQKSALKPSRSLPSVAAYENRFSNGSGRTRNTTCSGDSEWDVAQAYGASRFSKESAAGGSILSTISEATMESVEAVEVGGKQCVLMKGKF
ncbi:hypothetical protein EIP91_007841 [Steccherinum ochraceum]|uniref:Mid2 domain-containing protein n=1 Tax=Steccherinum ochraceum TaxID=92696 RepID=A0A4R0R3Q5_9APHY|nr:hypothetical protein EIP91_007841 [Steccherinum ochraceum]